MYHCKYHVHLFLFRVYILFRSISFICLYVHVYTAKSAKIANMYQIVVIYRENMNKYLFIIPITVLKRRLIMLYRENKNKYLFIKSILPNRHNQVHEVQSMQVNTFRKEGSRVEGESGCPRVS